MEKMNDRFKFRAWHKPTKKLFEVYTFTNEDVYENTSDGVGTPTNPADMKDCILEQCTGLKDKNGRLIYEGDIVKIDNWFYGKGKPDDIAVIKRNSRYAHYDILTKTHEYDFSYYDGHDVEIIGNIHENPELLEGTK